MKSSIAVENLLNTYEIPKPDPKHMETCVRQAKLAVQTKEVRREASPWFLIESQIKYIRGEILLSFLISLVAILLLQFAKVISGNDAWMEITIGAAPFLLVPIVLSLVKSRKNGMLELETASKFGVAKIIGVRILINQALAIGMIVMMWLFSSVALEMFALNRLLFSLIFFETASICFLWFGKASVKSGIFSAAVWTGILLLFLSWEKAAFWMNAVNSVVLILVTLAVIGISLLMIDVYRKEISLESEDTKWNLSWTD